MSHLRSFNQKYAGNFERMRSHTWRKLLGILIGLYLMGCQSEVDSQVDSQPQTDSILPPQKYEPADLSQYAAKEFSEDEIILRGSIYVPTYSFVYTSQGRPQSLESTLSIRNIDTERKVYLKSVRYHDTSGQQKNEYLTNSIQLRPLETIEFLVETRDHSGGSGANFMVEWFAT